MAVVRFDVMHCTVIWGFLCVVIDLKPTASLIEPIYRPEGKWWLETWWLSIDGGWHTPTPDEIELSHKLTLNPSLIDSWTPLLMVGNNLYDFDISRNITDKDYDKTWTKYLARAVIRFRWLDTIHNDKSVYQKLIGPSISHKGIGQNITI